MPKLLVTAVMPSVFYVQYFGFASAPFKSEAILNFNVMKFFKSEEQEMRFCIVGMIICLSIVLVLKLLKLLQ